MLDNVASNDNDGGDGDEHVGTDVCNINGFLAQEYIIGKLVPKTRRQYQLCVSKTKGWIKTNYSGDNSSLEKMKLPLSEKAIMEFLASAGMMIYVVPGNSGGFCQVDFRGNCFPKNRKFTWILQL